MRDADRPDIPARLRLRTLPDRIRSLRVPERPEWLQRAQERMGLTALPSILFVSLVATWAVVALTLFLGFYAVLWQTIFQEPLEGQEAVWNWRFSIAQLVALTTVMGAVVALPITINRLVLTRRQTETTEQGHITDRINTAVQGLGAEKEVNQIGRPVTVWTGKPKNITHLVDNYADFEIPPRSVEGKHYHDSFSFEEIGKEDFNGLHVEVTSWPEERTVIQIQGKDVEASETEKIGTVGEWKVFTETQANLEVRIGAIYALERIAQDSDRDHVQIMEIFCAYIRQNAPAPAKDDWPELEMKDGEDEGPLEADWGERLEKFEQDQETAKANLKPREDIQTALTVIGRRSAKQRRLEAGRGKEAPFPYDTPCPEYHPYSEEHHQNELWLWLEDLKAWKRELEAYEGYRLDLRKTDLRGADLSERDLKGAKLTGTYLQGANIVEARLQGADLWGARLQGADLPETRLQGAILWWAFLQGADLDRAHLEGADLMGAQLQGADLSETRLQGAILAGAVLHGACREE